MLVLGSLAAQGVPPGEILKTINESAAALVGILAVIPIGFMTYQAYYLGVRPIVWTSRIWGIRRIWGSRARPRIDRGANVLSVFTEAELGKIRQLYGLVEFGGEDDLRRKWIEQEPADGEESDELLDCERRILDAKIRGTIPIARQDRLENSKWPKRMMRWVAGRLGMRELAPDFIERWPFNTAGSPDEEWEQAKAFYELRWRTNWDLLVALIEAAGEYPDTASIKHEYTILSDLYHALGACRTACSLAFSASAVTIMLYLPIADGNPGWAAVAIGASFAICLGLWLLLNHSRRQTWRAASQMVRHCFRRLVNRHPEFLAPGAIDPA
jgi:hypothetical protein